MFAQEPGVEGMARLVRLGRDPSAHRLAPHRCTPPTPLSITALYDRGTIPDTVLRKNRLV